MRIDFNKVEIHNFLSFADEIFCFPSNASLNLVCGKNNDIPGSSNGAGKTVLFQSIVFALFGQTKDNIKNEHIHNRHVKGKDLRVVLWFSIGSNCYKVASGFNASGRPYCEFFQIADGQEQDMSKSSIAETRKFIADEILHCDMPIFLRTVLLSSDQNYNFFRLKKADKKEFIEKLFDISMFKDMYDLMHKDSLSLDKQLAAIQNKLLVLNKNNDTYAKQSESYLAMKSAKASQLQQEIAKLEAQQDILRSKKIKTNQEQVSKYSEACQILNDKLTSLHSALNDASAKKHETDVAVAAAKSDMQNKEKALSKHKVLMAQLCSKCLTKFKSYFSMSSYEDDIAEDQKKLGTMSSIQSKIAAEIKKTQSEIDGVQRKIDTANQKIRSLTSEFNDNASKLAVVEQQLHDAQSRLAVLQAEDNPYQQLIAHNNEELAAEQKKLSEAAFKYKHLKFAESIVSQDTIRKFIISDLISLLNNKIRHYLSKFGANYYVVFDSDMNYVFKTSNGECEYDNFSSGERARIMIATCFAFRDFMRIKNNLSSNILVLDEFIDAAIDSLAIGSIIDVLKQFSMMHSQSIYVISHRKEAVASDNFNSIIQVEKTNGLSQISFDKA